MKHPLCIVLSCLGLSFLFLNHPLSAAENRPSVSSVSFHTENGGKERVRIKLEGMHSPQVYPMNGEKPRLVIDLPGAGYAGLVTPVVKDHYALVKGIRIGVHGQPSPKTRVVLDLEPGRKYTYSREFVKAENVLNVILVPAGAGKKVEAPVVTIKKTEAPAVTIKKSEAPIVKITAKESKQVIADKTNKTANPEIAKENPPPAAAEKAVGETAAPVQTAKREAAIPASPVGQQAKTPEAVSAVPAASTPVAKAEVTETADPVAQKPVVPVTGAAKADKPVDKKEVADQDVEKQTVSAATEKKDEAMMAAAKPEVKETVTAEKTGTEAPAPVAALPTKAEKNSPKETEKALVQTEEPTPANPLLLDITYENNSSKGEMIFFRLNGFFPPSVSAVESGNPEVVCDFANTAQREGIKPVIEAKGAYVQKIITNRNSKRVRVTLQLSPGRDYDLRQVFFKEDNLFVLVVNAMDEESVGQEATDEKK